MRHLLDITDLGRDGLGEVLDLAVRPIADLGRPLEGLGAALIFEKPSNRTRHSMEMAVVQLGGHPVYTRGEEVGIDTREPAEDIVRILAGYHAVVAARVFSHGAVARMAAPDAVPVVNMLSDRSHPLQALADLLTMRREFGSLEGRVVVWVGDYNNVARSLAEGALASGMDIRFACPEGFGPDPAEVERLSLLGPGDVVAGADPRALAGGAPAGPTPPGGGGG
ncbi:MAG: ornithine carbamoyltransferase, partial [Ilumatobacteraceae bacterium]